MRKSTLLLFVILIAVIMISCDAAHDAVAPNYVITFHKNPPDGSKDKTIKVEIKDGKRLPDAKKDMGWSFDNYEFDCWKTKKGDKRERALDKSPLYAQWKAVNN